MLTLENHQPYATTTNQLYSHAAGASAAAIHAIPAATKAVMKYGEQFLCTMCIADSITPQAGFEMALIVDRGTPLGRASRTRKNSSL